MIFEENNSLRFVRNHRAPRTRLQINLVTALASLGVILLIVTGVMINADLGIL